MTYQQYVIELCELRRTIVSINYDYASQHKPEPFTLKQDHALNAGIDALKTLDDMGNTMQKILSERSKSYETTL